MDTPDFENKPIDRRSKAIPLKAITNVRIENGVVTITLECGHVARRQKRPTDSWGTPFTMKSQRCVECAAARRHS